MTEREHFIPVRKAELVDLLCGQPELGRKESHDFRQLCRLLEATFHFEYHEKLEELKNCYGPFDPDADTRSIHSASEEEQEKLAHNLFDRFTWLLERANFKRLSQDEIVAALRGSSGWGLNLDVDFSVFDRLEIYARGEDVEVRKRRHVRNGFRLSDVRVPVFRRLVIILRLRQHHRLQRHIDTKNVYIKVFKDIPKMDLEMLLPGTKVRMTLLDRGRLSFPFVTGFGIAGWKLFIQGLALAAVFGGAVTQGVLALAGIVGFRSFMGYQQAKRKYMLTLTQSLYYLSLDSNAGVLFRLLDEAEEQECREAMLAYYFLWRQAGPEGWTVQELDEQVEHFLERTLHRNVDFEIGDALAKLERLQIVDLSADGRLHAVPLAVALARLDHAWDSYFRYSGPEPASPTRPRIAAMG